MAYQIFLICHNCDQSSFYYPEPEVHYIDIKCTVCGCSDMSKPTYTEEALCVQLYQSREKVRELKEEKDDLFDRLKKIEKLERQKKKSKK